MARDPYLTAYEAARPGVFTFKPDIYDPELLEARRRTLRRGEAQRGSTLNELYRMGLGGTSAALGALRESDQDMYRGLEDVESGVFSKQRGFAESLFTKDLDFRQQLQLLRLQDQLEKRRRKSALLGGLGKLAGLGLGYFTGGVGGTGLWELGSEGLGDFEPFLEDSLYG